MARRVLATVALAWLAACGHLVGTDERVIDETLTCTDGVCACAAGFDDCDGELGNGCEDTQSDTRHCGACGVLCRGECVGGECRPFSVLAVSNAFERYGVSDTHVFSATCDGLQKMRLPDGAVETVGEESGCPAHVVLNDGMAFFTGGDKISSVRADAGEPKLLVADQSFIIDLVVDEEIYWLAVDVPATEVVLRRADRDGAGVKELIRVPERMEAMQLRIDGRQLYWSRMGSIQAVDLDSVDLGSAPAVTDVVVSAFVEDAFAIAGDYVYWHSFWANVQMTEVLPAIHRVPLAGGSSEVFVEDVGVVTSMAADDSYLYWTDWITNDISRVPLEGGAPQVIAEAQADAMWLVIDGEWIYWQTTAGIVRMHR